MTTLTPAAPRGVRALVGGRGFATLLRTESRVWMRDAATVFFSLAFPTVLLLGVGFGIPGMREPMNDVPGEWVGLTPVAAYVPVLLAVSLATPLLTVMPVAFGQYRERGVLRRLSTTPMRPQALVVTHLLINLAAIVAASGVMLIVGEIAFGLELPRNVGTVALAYLLGIAAMYSLGVLVAARHRGVRRRVAAVLPDALLRGRVDAGADHARRGGVDRTLHTTGRGGAGDDDGLVRGRSSRAAARRARGVDRGRAAAGDQAVPLAVTARLGRRRATGRRSGRRGGRPRGRLADHGARALDGACVTTQRLR